MDARGERPDMLEDPGISRQWVLRRLQKALSADLAVAALLAGMERTAGGRWRETVAFAGERAADRARVARELIVHEGGAPYSSVGLARGASRVGGWLLGLLGPRIGRLVLVPVAEQSYAELDGLVAFARTASGVSGEVAARLEPEVQHCREVLDALRAA